MDKRKLLLNDYLDGSLPPDLARRLEGLLEEDPELKAVHQREIRLRRALSADSQEARNQIDNRLDHAKDRVWERIQTRRSLGRAVKSSWWHRSFPVPIPVAAAMVLALVGVLAIGSLARGSYVPNPTLAAGSTVIPVGTFASTDGASTTAAQNFELTIQVNDLNQLLSILEGGLGDSSLKVTIPSAPSFEYLGEPMLIKASERP